jgi:hypothetical protein
MTSPLFHKDMIFNKSSLEVSLMIILGSILDLFDMFFLNAKKILKKGYQ